MKKQLAKLLDIKCVIAILMCLVYSYILIKGMPVDESFKSVILVIIGYLFGSSIKGTQH